MMNLSLEQLCEITSAKLVGDFDEKVSSLLIDSRSLVDSRGVMFCALRTEASDGHRYIAEMYRKGVRIFLVECLTDGIASMPDAAFLIANSVEVAISQIALYWRKTLSEVNFIGITGSVGKTVFKELLYQSLLQYTRVARSPRSWNSRLGVPLSICELTSDLENAIIEVGIDRSGDMCGHAKIVCPQIGILMPITSEHDAGFTSREDKIREKIKLFDSCKTIFYDGSDALVSRLLSELQPTSALIAVDAENDLDFNFKLLYSVLNYLGFSVVEIKAMVNGVKTPVNRLDVHDGINDCVIIYDGFTNDFRSLVSALDFMRRRATATRKNTLITTDLLHPEMSETELSAYYTEVCRMLDIFGIERVVAIGEEFAKYVSFKVETVPTIEIFLNTYDINNFSSETITIFGSLEEIKDRLESPRHDSILEVNLNSIIRNFNYYRSLLNSSTSLVAMVKASAYGIGAVEVAKTLQAQGAAYLAVAVIDEGVELRRGGITMPIMVLNPITGNYKALFDYNLEPSVFSMRELETLLDEAARFGINNFKAHVKLDTGMHRVGFVETEIPALVECLLQTKTLQVASVFSHLATADCLDMDDYTESQLKAFEQMSSQIVEALPYMVKRHILNTAGIMRYADYQYDMVRLGIGLYGVSPIPEVRSDLATVASLRTTIISLKRWKTGTTIGYSCSGRLEHDAVIATIPIGYADGIDRHLGRGAASFMVKGEKCPTVGNICMDLCMIDVTAVPEVAIGDSVEVFGTEIPVESLAEKLDTIPYELLTSVSPRVKRIYFRD